MTMAHRGKIKTVANMEDFAIVGVTCLADTLRASRKFILQIKFSTKNPRHSKISGPLCYLLKRHNQN